MTLKDFNSQTKLLSRQWRVFQKWALNMGADKWEPEDCCGTDSFTFSFTHSGLGPTVIVSCGKKKLDITIGDDNEFVSEEAQRWNQQT